MPAGPEMTLAQQKLINGVTVVSTMLGAKINALTVAWVSRVSYSPPLVMIAIGKTRYSHDMIKESGVFAVNVLSTADIETARHFGLKSGRKTDKFEGLRYGTKTTGSPILDDCMAWMDCRVVSKHDAGSHTIFIGEVLDGAVKKNEDALVYDKEKIFGKTDGVAKRQEGRMLNYYHVKNGKAVVFDCRHHDHTEDEEGVLVYADDPEAALIIARKHAKGKTQPEYVTCGSCRKPHPVLR